MRPERSAPLWYSMVMGCSCTSAVSRLVARQVWTSIAHTRSVAAIELKLKEEEDAIAAVLGWVSVSCLEILCFGLWIGGGESAGVL
jgi:hypothetical protein